MQCAIVTLTAAFGATWSAAKLYVLTLSPISQHQLTVALLHDSDHTARQNLTSTGAA